MKKIVKKGKIYYQIEQFEVEQCLALVEGFAKPSDFGYDFTWTALLLAHFATQLEKALSKDTKDSPYKIKTRDAIKKAKELAKLFGEAGDLSGEWDEDKK